MGGQESRGRQQQESGGLRPEVLGHAALWAGGLGWAENPEGNSVLSFWQSPGCLPVFVPTWGMENEFRSGDPVVKLDQPPTLDDSLLEELIA